MYKKSALASRPREVQGNEIKQRFDVFLNHYKDKDVPRAVKRHIDVFPCSVVLVVFRDSQARHTDQRGKHAGALDRATIPLMFMAQGRK
jgi:hypothetical protein